MKLDERGRKFIQAFEGLRLTAYLCPAKVWTIGYGHTGDVAEGMTITLEQAEALFAHDVAVFEQGVLKLVKVPLTQNQFNALVSFAYNLGLGNLAKSTLLRRLNSGNYAAVPVELMKWDKAGGKPVAGLTRRREGEGELWNA